jgi:hypothetical protein
MPKQALDASDIDTTHDPLRGSKMSKIMEPDPL